MKRILLCCAILLVGSVGAYMNLSLFSLVNPERLIPVSVSSILQAVLLAYVLYLGGTALINALSDIPNRVSYFTIAFLLRVLVALLLTFVFQFDDERTSYAAGIEQRYGLFSWEGGKGFYHLTNMIYAIFGPNFLLPKMVNALLGALLPFFAYDLGLRLFADTRAAWRTFLFTAFLPPLVIYSAVTLKEIPTAFLLVFILWFLVVSHRSVIEKTVGIVVSLAVLYWLRGAPWMVMALMGVATYLLLGETWRLRSVIGMRLLPNLLLGGLVAFFVLPFLLEPIREVVLSRLTREALLERYIDSSATVMQFVDISQPLSFQNLAIFFFRGLYSPSPLRFLFDYGLSPIIEALTMIVWYVLFPFAIIGFLAERRKGGVIACGVIGLGILAVATMGVMVGTDPYRHRVPMMGLLFILAGGGFTREVWRRNQSIFYLWWLGVFLFTASWIRFRI